MQESHVILVGNLTADPSLKSVPSGAKVCNFRIGVTPRWRDKESGQWRDGDSMFYGVDCWRALAENANDTLRKGDRVVVVGRLRQNSWTSPEGQERSSVEVEAETVGPDLNRHVAILRKVSRNSAPSGGSDPSGGGGATPGVDAEHPGFDEDSAPDPERDDLPGPGRPGEESSDPYDAVPV
jgi:single-strand DNA-binding protein